MFGWLNRALGNTSVKLKLSMGFGLVLTLTLAITLTGWHGLDTVIARAESITAIGQLNSLNKDLRSARILFRGEGTQANASAVEDLLAELDKQLDLLRGDVDNKASLELLTEQSRIVSSMKKSFTELSEARKTREARRELLEEQSTRAVKAVEDVESEVLKTVSQEQDNGERLEEFTNISQLKQQIQTARYQVQAYTMNGQEVYEDAATTAIGEAIKEVEEIALDQADDNLKGLKHASEALQRYRGQLAEFQSAQVKVDSAQKNLDTLSEQMLVSVAGLIDKQTAQRDQEAALSRTTLTQAGSSNRSR